MGLEGRLRGGRGGGGALPPALRPRHAARGRRRSRRTRRHAAHAGDPRGPRTLPDPALRGPAQVSAVLDAAASGLRSAAGRDDPARRRGAGAQRGHRHVGRDGAARPRQGRRRAAPQRARRRPLRTPRRAVSGQHRHPPQRGVDQGPPARTAPHRGPDESALLGKSRDRAHPPSRGSASHPLGLLDAPARRAAGGDLVGALRPRRCRVARRVHNARSASPRGVHRAHRRPRLCAARHQLRHPPHRSRQRRRKARASLRRPPGARRRPPAAGDHRHRAGAASHLRHECRARAGRGPVRPGARAPSQAGQAAPPRPAGDADGRARLGRCVRARLRGGAGRRRSRQGRAALGTLRAMAGIRHPRAGRRRAPDPAGAVRCHGGRLAPHAVLPPDAAAEGGDRGSAVRRPARERGSRRPGARAPPRRRVPHRRRLGDGQAR